MKQDFTQFQLLRLVYGETTKAETDLLLELAFSVPEIGEMLADMETGKQALEGEQLLPRAAVLDRIMTYSAATGPVPAN